MKSVHVFSQRGKLLKRTCVRCKRSKSVIAFPIPSRWDQRDVARCVSCHEAAASQ